MLVIYFLVKWISMNLIGLFALIDNLKYYVTEVLHKVMKYDTVK